MSFKYALRMIAGSLRLQHLFWAQARVCLRVRIAGYTGNRGVASPCMETDAGGVAPVGSFQFVAALIRHRSAENMGLRQSHAHRGRAAEERTRSAAHGSLIRSALPCIQSPEEEVCLSWSGRVRRQAGPAQVTDD